MKTTQRTKFKVDSESVTVTYRDEFYGETVTRTFYVRGEFGYVREIMSGGRQDIQVCERLAGMGNTLLCSKKNLGQVIRREYRAMRRQEKAILNRY